MGVTRPIRPGAPDDPGHARSAPSAAEPPVIAEFHDPRLVSIYDTINGYGADAQPRFSLRLARKLAATSIVDSAAVPG